MLHGSARRRHALCCLLVVLLLRKGHVVHAVLGIARVSLRAVLLSVVRAVRWDYKGGPGVHERTPRQKRKLYEVLEKYGS
eukprot:COSAG02_NODE_21366_length_791_cov_0.894509_1_plen_80_part_00